MFLNADRILVKILKEIAKEENIIIDMFSHNWIIRLQKGEKVKHVMGYDFDLNSSSSQLIAKDKCGSSELLKYAGVPCVEHELFISPDKSQYVGSKSNWDEITKYAKKLNYNLICKSNIGTGGSQVTLINNPLELENAVYSLFSKDISIALSPFYSIKNEYRVIVLKGESQLVFCKIRPSVVGDGTSNLLQLIASKFKNNELNGLLEYIDRDISFNKILNNGEKIELGWKHNLAMGSKPEILEDSVLKENLITLAITASKVLNIEFASVDIVEIENELMVLEVNSGIMMESFARHSDNGYKISKEIYKKAVMQMFMN